MKLTIDETSMIELIDQIMLTRGFVPEETLTGKTIGIEEFRKTYCGNKSPDWVRTFIFDRFPEIDRRNGGWCVNPRASAEGKKTIIFAHPASQWMETNSKKIDWNARIADLGR